MSQKRRAALFSTITVVFLDRSYKFYIFRNMNEYSTKQIYKICNFTLSMSLHYLLKLKLRIHDATRCTTGCTTGCLVYTQLKSNTKQLIACGCAHCRVTFAEDRSVFFSPIIFKFSKKYCFNNRLAENRLHSDGSLGHLCPKVNI